MLRPRGPGGTSSLRSNSLDSRPSLFKPRGPGENLISQIQESRSALLAQIQGSRGYLVSQIQDPTTQFSSVTLGLSFSPACWLCLALSLQLSLPCILDSSFCLLPGPVAPRIPERSPGTAGLRWLRGGGWHTVSSAGAGLAVGDPENCVCPL